jgi:hypothetical protein
MLLGHWLNQFSAHRNNSLVYARVPYRTPAILKMVIILGDIPASPQSSKARSKLDSMVSLSLLHAPIPSQIFAYISSDFDASVSPSSISSSSSSSTKNLIPKFSSAAYKRVEIAVRPPLTKTSRTEESRKAWIVRGSEALSFEVVKRVCGASSGAVFIRLEEGGSDGDVDVDVEGKEGLVILKVSVRGLKDRVVLRVKSGVVVVLVLPSYEFFVLPIDGLTLGMHELNADVLAASGYPERAV